MFEKDRFFFFENGVTTFNLPVADHVLGARASRTTHPRVLKAFEQLFSLLLRRPIKIHNPYIWRTKAGVLATLSALGAMDLLPHTVSCASVRSISMRNKQCGVCSQCVERRFAVGAAGLSDHEPADFYHTDMFRGAHEDPRDLMMAECHVLRARKLAGMSDQAMLSAYGEIFRAVPFLPGSPDEIARAICDLHRRYGREVITVLDLELRKSSSLEQSLELPATSLLAMIRAPIGIQPHLDPTETEPSVATQAEADTSSVPRHQFILGLDYKSRAVFFLDGPRLGGASFELIRVLVEQAEKADAAGLPRIQTGYLSVPALQDLFDVDAETLRKRVAFTRQKLREHFLGRRDFPIDEQDIIESRQRLGYRLNPHVLVVDVAQIRNGRGSHESSE
jgi:hypothetical protein